MLLLLSFSLSSLNRLFNLFSRIVIFYIFSWNKQVVRFSLGWSRKNESGKLTGTYFPKPVSELLHCLTPSPPVFSVGRLSQPPRWGVPAHRLSCVFLCIQRYIPFSIFRNLFVTLLPMMSHNHFPHYHYCYSHFLYLLSFKWNLMNRET